jgi:plasmid stability protein
VKTTIDLADSLAASLKARTARDGISMRAAVHEALRLWLKTRPEVPHRISREIGLMTGHGLTAEAASATWEELRALSYDEKI